MTAKQQVALELMRRARAEGPTTDDGVCVAAATWYDSEINVAMVNVRTAQSLVDVGLCRWGMQDPEWGWELVLVEGVETTS